MGRSKSQRSEATVEGIVDAALRVVHQHGPAAVSVRTVAREAGLATGTVTYHFKNREELIERCFDRYYDEFRKLQQQFLQRFAAIKEPRALASECVRTLFRWAAQNPVLHRLRLQTTLTLGGRDERRFAGTIYPALQMGARLLSPRVGRPEAHLRLFLLTFSNSIARTVSESERELRQVTGAETHAEALQVLEDYYVGLALAYLFGDGPAGDPAAP